MLRRVENFLSRRSERLDARISTKIDNLYNQLTAYQDLRNVIGQEVTLGPLRGWAISPDALLVVLQNILARQNPLVIEFGSGESTLAIAALLAKKGSGRLTSVEHDPDYARKIEKRLASANLDSFVEVKCLHTGMIEIPSLSKSVHSYLLENLDAKFDVCLIDGPPITMDVHSRSVPLAWALRHLMPGSVIYLDDAARTGETAAALACVVPFPNVKSEQVATEKGLFVASLK